MGNFVKKLREEHYVVSTVASKGIMCNGARHFDNGNIACWVDGEISVFNSQFSKIDSFLRDVYYFKTGQVLKLYMADPCWGFYNSKGKVFAHAKKVKVLGERVAAIKLREGFFEVYAWNDDEEPSLFFKSTKNNVEDVLLLKNEVGEMIVCFVSKNEVEIQRLKMVNKKSVVSMMGTDCKFLNNDFMAVSLNGKLLKVLHGDNCFSVRSDAGLNFDIYDSDLKLRYHDVEKFYAFKNGAYIVCLEGECLLYAKSGREVARFRAVELRAGADVWAQYVDETRLEYIGQYDDKFVWFMMNGKATVVGEDVLISNVNSDFRSLILI